MALVGRRAVPGDAAELSELALRSKAIWGYSAEFMARCREELTLTPDQLEENWGYIYEDLGASREKRLVGFVLLSRCSAEERVKSHAEMGDGDVFEVEALFVEPERLGEGIGRRLFTEALRACKAAADHGRLWIQSDPNAEAFYLSCGAVRVGERESSSIPGRYLPLLAVDW